MYKIWTRGSHRLRVVDRAPTRPLTLRDEEFTETAERQEAETRRLSSLRLGKWLRAGLSPSATHRLHGRSSPTRDTRHGPR
ncbi:hypothetical protein EYF80_044763 [Liparis tanakae]|uniref:Uncharacterized protein n=1 Tax=Liparis tanakae TaxID=230148 RepID=A0A4Z2FUW3_9TELE|nr:hypothetical protein EYF80_044763 [Liparis tanakae]